VRFEENTVSLLLRDNQALQTAWEITVAVFPKCLLYCPEPTVSCLTARGWRERLQKGVRSSGGYHFYLAGVYGDRKMNPISFRILSRKKKNAVAETVHDTSLTGSNGCPCSKLSNNSMSARYASNTVLSGVSLSISIREGMRNVILKLRRHLKP
jgi:hypothetical protein